MATVHRLFRLQVQDDNRFEPGKGETTRKEWRCHWTCTFRENLLDHHSDRRRRSDGPTRPNGRTEGVTGPYTWTHYHLTYTVEPTQYPTVL